MDETRIEAGQLSQFGATGLKHRDAGAIYRLWSEMRGDRKTPFRAELDAGSIGAQAPYLAIVENVGAFNYRLRLSGERLNKWFGMELRGMSALAMVGPDGRNHLLATLNRVTSDPAVAVIHGQARRPDGLISRFELLLLPMRSDFGRVDRILAGMWLLDAETLTNGPFSFEALDFTVAAIDDSAPVEVEAPVAELAEPPAAFAPAADPAVEESRQRIAALREKVAAMLGEGRDEYEDFTLPESKSFTPVAGGGAGGGERRRGHLRLVKDS